MQRKLLISPRKWVSKVIHAISARSGGLISRFAGLASVVVGGRHGWHSPADSPARRPPVAYRPASSR
jgi:hypothetical protein